MRIPRYVFTIILKKIADLTPVLQKYTIQTIGSLKKPDTWSHWTHCWFYLFFSHRQQFFAAAAAAQARASAFANYRMPGHFQGGPNNPGVPGRLPFFNDAFFRPPYHFGMLGSHKNGDLGPRQAVNGFPFPPGNGAHFGPQHRPPFFPRITDDFTLRQSNQHCFNQVINRINIP